jgi:hypothetical protein
MGPVDCERQFNHRVQSYPGFRLVTWDWIAIVGFALLAAYSALKGGGICCARPTHDDGSESRQPHGQADR